MSHLQMAEINVFNHHTQPASDSLQTALSLDFSMRNNIRYLLLKSKVLKGQVKYDEAIGLLSELMNAGKVKELLSSMLMYINPIDYQMKIYDLLPNSEITVSDCLAIFIELADCYCLQKKIVRFQILRLI